MRDAFICDAVRTPVGRYGGALSGVRADDLAALLHTCFDRVDVQVRNSVALFAAWVG